MCDHLDPRWGELQPLHDPRILARFRARPGDILITTAPKAGTTWMQQILHQLRTGGDSSFTSIDTVVPWLERQRHGKSWREILEYFESLPNPRIFKTHCTFPQTPGSDVVRLILSSRDPRDCCVSFYHHLLDMTDEARERHGVQRPVSFDDYLEHWLAFGAWYRNIASWWPHIHDGNLLWLRYEDMKADLSGCIDRLLLFLGWSLTNEQRRRILEYCSFDWMKTNAEKFTRETDSDTPAFKRGGCIRKGKTGDYRNLLTTAHEERILAKAKAELTPECLGFLGIE